MMNKGAAALGAAKKKVAEATSAASEAAHASVEKGSAALEAAKAKAAVVTASAEESLQESKDIADEKQASGVVGATVSSNTHAVAALAGKAIGAGATVVFMAQEKMEPLSFTNVALAATKAAVRAINTR